jgi:hypothetical protein
MSTTKLELQQTNTRLANENEVLRARVAQLEGDIERITSVASAINTVNQARPGRPQWQEDRAIAMAAAKALAVGARIVVKV